MVKTNRFFPFFSLQKIWYTSTILLSFIFFLTACSFNEIFYKFYSFPYSEWNKETVIRFEVPIKDISVPYDVFFELRHTNTYPFCNLWLFANYRSYYRNSRQDTICVELADKYGKWHGNGIHLYTCIFPYQLNIQYPDTGTYVYTICQGMRESPLKGISNFGLRVVKKYSNKLLNNK